MMWDDVTCSFYVMTQLMFNIFSDNMDLFSGILLAAQTNNMDMKYLGLVYAYIILCMIRQKPRICNIVAKSIFPRNE